LNAKAEKLPMWIDRAVKWLLPRETHFFDLIERGAARACEISALLAQCCSAASRADREVIVEQMRRVEHDADRVIAEVYEAINRTFVTPLDRSDIYALAVSLEELADAVFATALQFVVHAMEDLPAGSGELAALVVQSCEAIQTAVANLRDMKNPAAIRAQCELIERLETEGDRIYRTQIAAMFRTETDAIRLIKHKEFLEGLERTLDVCEDVGGALRTVVIKNA
jgi:uncharacterized protein Yka (UPF0111/DUF47 family)